MLNQSTQSNPVAFMSGDIWSRMGAKHNPSKSVEQWLADAGLNWSAVKVPLWADVKSLGLKEPGGNAMRGVKLPETAVVRSDTGNPLGIVSDGYHVHQTSEIIESFRKLISLDDRFQLERCGQFKGGRIIWAQAVFADQQSIVGEPHKARLLSSTTFDGTGSTTYGATMLRVSCMNSLRAAISSAQSAMVKTRHSTKFDAARAQRALNRLIAEFDEYREMAEAMVAQSMSIADTSNFFKAVLEIPFDAKPDDISTRKMNQFRLLNDAYQATLREGTQPKTAWTALNAVTRYVDHDRSTRNGNGNADEARVLSSQFGSGAALKAKAVQLLLGRDGALIEQEVEDDAAQAPSGLGSRSLLDQVLDAPMIN